MKAVTTAVPATAASGWWGAPPDSPCIGDFGAADDAVEALRY